MKIAIISFDFIESTLPLAKHLSINNDVSFFVFTSTRRKNQPGLDLEGHWLKYGLSLLNTQKYLKLHGYLGESKLRIYTIHLPPSIYFLNKLCQRIHQKVIYFLNKNNFEIANIIGQNDQLIQYHKGLNFSTIHTFHEVFNHIENTKLNSKLLNYVLCHGIKIIVHSDFTFFKFLEYYPNHKQQVDVVPFGFFESFNGFFKSSNVEMENTILFIGHINKYKGIEILLDAFRSVINEIPNALLVIAGKPNNEYKKLLKNINSDRISIIDKSVSNSDLVELVQKSTIIVCPYSSASQSGIPMLSFNFNKPIIASNVGAFCEVIENDFNGYIVPYNNIDILTQKIIFLLKSKQTRMRFKNNIDSMNNERLVYNWSNISRRTIELYEARLKNDYNQVKS